MEALFVHCYLSFLTLSVMILLKTLAVLVVFFNLFDYFSNGGIVKI